MKLNNDQLTRIDTFLFRELTVEFSREQRERAYKNWFRGGCGWNSIQQGGTGQMRAILWYQNIYKPNSNEWRPKIIIEALLTSIKPKQPTDTDLDSMFDGKDETAPLVPNTEQGDLFTKEREGIF